MVHDSVSLCATSTAHCCTDVDWTPYTALSWITHTTPHESVAKRASTGPSSSSAPSFDAIRNQRITRIAEYLVPPSDVTWYAVSTLQPRMADYSEWPCMELYGYLSAW